jgi:hypothetical protein
MIPNISGSTSQNVSSTATGGQFDAQGKFSFGGINNGSATQSYVAMGILGAVVLVVLVLALRRR